MLNDDYDLEDDLFEEDLIPPEASSDSGRAGGKRGGEDRVIKIRELDPNSLIPTSVSDDGAKYVVIGKPSTGKSRLIDSLLYSKKHIVPVGEVYSGTEDSNGFYCQKLPSLFVYPKLDVNQVIKFKERQKIAKSYLENPWAVQIIDDCTDNPAILRSPLFHDYYKNGRHWKMLHFLSLQYSMDIPPVIRTCIDGTFILRETTRQNRERLWKNYSGCIDSFADFNDIMDQVTNDYTALFINNRVQSNNIEDVVFYYKADLDRIPKGWKFGCDDFWEFHYKRSDPNYTEPSVIS